MAKPPTSPDRRGAHQLVTELTFTGSAASLLRKLADRIDAGEVRCSKLGFELTEDHLTLAAEIDMKAGVQP